MVIRAGLGAQVGIAKESVYGTFTAPTRWLEVKKADPKKVKNTVQGGGVAAGRLQKLGSRRVVTTIAGAGTIETEVHNKGMGLLLQALMGSSAIAQQGATAAWLQTHTLGDTFGQSLTLQNGLPQLSDGVAKPYNFLGSKVLSGEFSCGVDETLASTWELDCRDVEETSALAAPSYPTSIGQFHFGQMDVKIGATAAAAAHVDGVRKASVKIERASRTDRFYAGNAGKKNEPVLNADQPITGTLDVDYVTKADFADRFAADTGFALVWEFIGPIIAGAFNETFRITLPQCFLTGDTPVLDSEDIVTGPFPFVSQSDGATQPKIEFMSTDTTIT